MIEDICRGKPKKKGDDIPTKINLLNIGDSLLLLPCGWGTDEFKGKPTEIKCQTDYNDDRRYRCRHVIREKNEKKGLKQIL